MKKVIRNLKLTALLVLLTAASAWAQVSVKGTVKDAVSGETLVGVNVLVKSSGKGVVTGLDGSYELSVPAVGETIMFTYVGFLSVERTVEKDGQVIDISLEEDVTELSDVVVVGSRFNPRSAASSPVPVDNISVEELSSTGHVNLDQMITYNAPSFNSSNQAISDATAHMNPADLRGLSPSRTLVLVNGKRKNQSALVYINDTPGKGEVGVDMQSIPAAAIERVEILRDGASAQYGSDAIAGVINLVLKDDVEFATVNTSAGITSEGDGAQFSVDGNYGFKIAEDGFLNVTASYSNQEHTNRPGDWRPEDDAVFLVPPTDAEVQRFPNAGMVVGQPDMTKNDVFFNAKMPLGDKAEFYANGGITYRKGNSFALHRNPSFAALYGSQETLQQIFGDNHFQPTFGTDIFDNSMSFGLKGEKNGWNFDLSSTFGSNSIDYTIGNTFNASMGVSSPTSFYAGGYEFSQRVNNLDVSKGFGRFSLAMGAEFRIENFKAFAGEPASYEGGGAISFPGLQPSNEVDKNRYNVGVYVDAEADVTDDFLVSGAVRFENYSDFGENVSGKLSGRYQLMDDKLNLRASVSTGFRAPSLHQIYMSNIQTLISDGTISEQGTFNNHSPILRAFNVPQLKEETAFNYGAGATYQATDKLLFTVDYYNITVRDRVVFTGAISNGDTTTAIGSILNDYNITSFKFFTNAIDTRTQGVDFVATYNGIEIGPGELNVSLAANYNETKIIGDLKTPDMLKNEGNVLFDRKERSRIESARPKDKVILGLNYRINKFGLTLNNTRFGEVTWRHATDPANDQTFSAKILTDLAVNYNVSDKVTFTMGANNLFNVYPDEIDPKGDVVTDLGGRFKYPWEVNQFGFNGTYVFSKLRIKI